GGYTGSSAGAPGYIGRCPFSHRSGASYIPGELSDLLKLCDLTDVLDAIVDEGEAGLPDVARPATVAGLARRVSPLLVVLPRSRDAEAFAQALAPWVS